MSGQKDRLSYLSVSENDERWGIVVTTVGYQFIPPGARYPLSAHPAKYMFSPKNGRVLNDYQLLYITKGAGVFSSVSCPETRVNAGTVILLFPGEWHSYHPDPDTGWDEYWVGFRGPFIDARVENSFFSRKEPLHHIGISSGIMNLFEEILNLAAEEKKGYQQMASSVVLHILGSVYYKDKNNAITDTESLKQINAAKQLMKQVENMMKVEDVAAEIGMGYSKFRKMFKEYTGSSPAQYQLQQRLIKAKELLTTTDMNISEIAYALRFENPGQFSIFFRRREGMTPSEFRATSH